MTLNQVKNNKLAYIQVAIATYAVLAM